MFVPKNTLYSHRVAVTATLNIYEIHAQNDGDDLKATLQPAFLTMIPAGALPMSGINNFLEKAKIPHRISSTGEIFTNGKPVNGVTKREASDEICKALTTQFKTNHFADRDGDKSLVVVVGQSLAFRF